MPLASLIPAGIMDTVLTHLAGLFLAGAAGNPTAARAAAVQMLAAYGAETPDELRLAADIISFGFHALEALSQASAADLSLTRVLRLRGSAVSLSREAHKSQRKLDQLQKARRAGTPPVHAVSVDASAPPQRPRNLESAEAASVETPDRTVQSPAAPPAKTWTQAYQQRLAAKRMAKRSQPNPTAPASHAGPNRLDHKHRGLTGPSSSLQTTCAGRNVHASASAGVST